MAQKIQLVDSSGNPIAGGNPLPISGTFSASPPTDTFSNATNITAATTFSGVPTISQLAASSSVLLANPGAQATFIAEIAVASAFVGTLSFYGLEPDGATLQLAGAHLRGVGTTANSIAINTGVAINQVWDGSAATFKAIYVVCTAFTSGSVSVQLGLSAAPYAQVILNTVATQAALGAFVDGAITTLGAEADAASTDSTQTNKTAMSYIKGWIKMLADVWDGTNHWLQVKVMNSNANGQALMVASAPVAISSDQSKLPTKAASGDFADGAINTLGLQADAAYTDGTGAASGTSQGIFKGLFVKLAAIATSVAGVLQVKRSTVAVYSLVSTTSTGATQNSGDLTVGAYTEIALDINTTAQAGTSPTIQLFYERKGADGIYYVLWQSAVLTAAANTLSTSIGAGMAYNQSLGLTGRLRWVVGGSSTPTYTFSANIYGK